MSAVAVTIFWLPSTVILIVNFTSLSIAVSLFLFIFATCSNHRRDNIMKMKKIKKRGSWTGEMALYAFIASLVCTSAGWYRLMAVCDFAFLLFAAMFIWYISALPSTLLLLPTMMTTPNHNPPSPLSHLSHLYPPPGGRGASISSINLILSSLTSARTAS